MNPLVKKEIRLLLPSFVIGCALGLGNLFFRFNSDGSLQGWWYFVLAYVFCGGVVVMLSLNSFGAEISSGTFSNLLAQPISRQKIWETKILLLAAALSIVGILWGGCGLIRLMMLGRSLDLPASFTVIGTFGLVVYSGGLWTVLLLRQMAAAFWFTVLVPGVILVMLAGLLAGQSDEFTVGMIVMVLGLYSLAGFFFARWLFFRAQDVAWSGGTIALPEMRGTSKIFARAAEKRFWRPQAALFGKELQLHQAQFIMAGVLALLHLGVLAARKFGHFQRNSSTEFILEIFWGLWLVMPLLVGAAAVAEERKLGTLGGQFGLPVKRRTQFAVKLRVTLLLAILFGAVMPLLLEGTRILPNVHSDFGLITRVLDVQGVTDWQFRMSPMQIFLWNCFGHVVPLLPLITLAGIAAAIGLISFYASTLTRNTLQALAPAVLGFVLPYFLVMTLARPDSFGLRLPWHGSLIYFIGLPVLAITLVAMSFRNFQRLNFGWQAGLRNALVFVAALAFVGVTTTAVYHRAWEKLTQFEPAHGVARLSLSNPATLSEQWNVLSVRLPDGRIWTDDYSLNTYSFNTSAPNPLALLFGDIRMASFGGGHFLDGSNWVSVLRGISSELAGIKTDGTLWVSEHPPHRERLAGGGWKVTKAGGLAQFGSGTNWSSIVPMGLSMLLVKSDGTLWGWGPASWDFKKQEWPGLRSFTPQRLGTESNWAEVFSADNQPFLRKTDGSVWTTRIDSENYQQRTELEPGFYIGPSLFEHGKWRATTIVGNNLHANLGVRDDGTFRIWADLKLNQTAHTNQYTLEQTAVDLQFGTDTNWVGIAGRGEKIVTLKNDGSLWDWNFQRDKRRGMATERDEREMLAVKPVRLGTHSDWIAVASADGGIISLAADGSLWYWPLESARRFVSEFSNDAFWDNNSNTYFEPLLDIYRKPQFLGNIFSKSE